MSTQSLVWFLVAGLVVVTLLPRIRARLLTSLAKHPSLRGHVRMAKRVARLVPFYEYGGARFFTSDGAPETIGNQREEAFDRLATQLNNRSPLTLAAADAARAGISDAQFTSLYRVPFQFRSKVSKELKLPTMVDASQDVRVRDLDGNWFYDLSGSYGVNVFGYDFYKKCIDSAVERVRPLGPVLGAYHPVIADNVNDLRQLSGLDEVSFHMSGTEAVMQTVRLARYHTGRQGVVRFCGAYHGWWDDVQPGIGNPSPVRNVLTLTELSEKSLRAMRARKDIACVLVNPLQAIHPNSNAPGDATLIASDRSAEYNKERYAAWLKRLREVCTEKGIVLIFDEVFLGFRLAAGGAQEYFGVKADMVTYGKTLGGGFPVGVVCGRGDLMRRFRADRPTDICFARGTFNSHPYILAAMREFLDHIAQPGVAESYRHVDAVWNGRAEAWNRRLESENIPVRVRNMASVFTTLYTQPSRYNWMLQYYLNAAGLMLSWVGTGRYIFSHNYSDADFDEVVERFVQAARQMQADGWWWESPELSNKTIRRRVLKEMVAARRSDSADKALMSSQIPAMTSHGRGESIATQAGKGG